jgi:hypothetical protein
VHKTFFYGSKHIDQVVPNVSPNPRQALMSSKQTVQQARPDMYVTTALASSFAYKGEKYVVPP